MSRKTNAPAPKTLTMLSVSQYATAFGIPTSTVRFWLSRGELPGAVKDTETNAWRIPVTTRRNGYVDR